MGNSREGYHILCQSSRWDLSDYLEKPEQHHHICTLSLQGSWYQLVLCGLSEMIYVECLHRGKLFNKYQAPSLLPWEESIVFSLLFHDLLPSHCSPSGYPCTKWDFHFLHSPYNHLHPLLVLKTSLTGSVIFSHPLFLFGILNSQVNWSCYFLSHFLNWESQEIKAAMVIWPSPQLMTNRIGAFTASHWLSPSTALAAYRSIIKNTVCDYVPPHASANGETLMSWRDSLMLPSCRHFKIPGEQPSSSVTLGKSLNSLGFFLVCCMGMLIAQGS